MTKEEATTLKVKQALDTVTKETVERLFATIKELNLDDDNKWVFIGRFVNTLIVWHYNPVYKELVAAMPPETEVKP